ncbi:hypothetical protein L873DRAFT_1821522 [Choiromyces venosus 120613-1]|uniref:Uncharacterized protein n=1 Tax=Choiromyces venosus 120613-1 TaxID=1336337 RepID=A0A3N4J8T7_9PEZI|nr:hypothetical protein L873DRAFT_1821522 [Choiromyces venosus 120613-1]
MSTLQHMYLSLINHITVPRLWLRYNLGHSSRECPTAQCQIRLNDTFNLNRNQSLTTCK